VNFTRRIVGGRGCLTVKNYWELLTGDDVNAPAKSISV